MKNRLSPFLWLFTVAFFIRALMPTGFMPDLKGQHILTICSETGISTIIVDENNQPLPEKPSHTSADSCPFSFLSTALLSDPNIELPSVTPPPVTAEGMSAFFLTGILPLSLNNHHLSRAPPKLS